MEASCNSMADLKKCGYLRSPCRIWPLVIEGVLAIGATDAAIGAAVGEAPEYAFIGELLQGVGTLAAGADATQSVVLTSLVVGTRNQSVTVGEQNLRIFSPENLLNPQNFDPTMPGQHYRIRGTNVNAAAVTVSLSIFGRLLGCP